MALGGYGTAMSSHRYKACDRLAEYLKTRENVRLIRRTFSAEKSDSLTILA